MAVKSARELSPLPPITCSRNISRIARRADSGASTPIRGTTLSARTCGVRAASRRPATAPCASTSPATTTGPVHRARASEPASSTSPSELPPSVPPTSSSTSGRDSRRAESFASSSPPASTATTLPPLDSATRRPASAVTSSSLPTTAIRRPPPADEQASTSASDAAGCVRASSARHASTPSRTSVSIGWSGGRPWPAARRCHRRRALPW